MIESAAQTRLDYPGLINKSYYTDDVKAASTTSAAPIIGSSASLSNNSSVTEQGVQDYDNALPMIGNNSADSSDRTKIENALYGNEKKLTKLESKSEAQLSSKTKEVENTEQAKADEQAQEVTYTKANGVSPILISYVGMQMDIYA